MNHSSAFSKTSLVVGVALSVIVCVPLVSHAQPSAGDVSAVIRSSLLQDPRTANLSQPELDAMVAILVAESEQKGLTAEQIQWRPGSDVSNSASELYVEDDTCASWPPLCTFNAAFGFDDPNSLVPAIFGVTSIGMVWILAEVLHVRSRRQKGNAQA